MIHTLKLSFKNLKIRQKYFIVTSLTIGLFILSSVYMYTFLADIQDSMNTMEKVGTYSELTAQVTKDFLVKDSNIADYIAFETEDSQNTILKQGDSINRQLETLKASVNTTQASEKILQIKKKEEEINKLISTTLKSAIENSDKEQISQTRVKLSGLRFSVLNIIDELNRDIFGPMQQKARTEMSNSIRKSIWTLFITIFISAVSGFILLTAISRVVQKNLNRVVQYSNQIADKKLDKILDLDDTRDEIGILGYSFKRMHQSLTMIIRSIYDTSVKVEDIGNFVVKSTEQLYSSGKQVSQTMESLSKGTGEQAQSAVSIAESVKKFEKDISDISYQSTEQIAYFQSIVKLSETGRKSLEETLEAFGKITGEVNSSVERMLQLDKSTNEIFKVIKIIYAVAEQTNLLSLNASIEAARAGENGKGFYVVAQEIEKLSGQVKSSLGFIDSINKKLKEDSNSTLNSLRSCRESVNNSILQIRNTQMIFESIHSGVNTMFPKLQCMSGAIEGIEEGSRNIALCTELISSASEEIAAGTQETAGIAAAQEDSLGKILYNTQELMKQVKSLVELISEFQLPENKMDCPNS